MLLVFSACSAPPSIPDVATDPPTIPHPTRPALSVTPPDTATQVDPDDHPLGLSYEIYVRSFQDFDGDGIGDLAGVRSRLDYLEWLGVETLWLMPLFPAVGPAGYDVLDFDQVRDDYGDTEDLRALLVDAHARGMRVLVDLPLNHVARTHPWFAAAEADPDSPERDRFVFSDTQWDTHRWFPASGGGWYYAFFGAELPDLDWRDDETRRRMLDVYTDWLGVVDGYRLDAVLFLIEAEEIGGTDETHALLAELRALAREVNPDAALLGEASEPDEALHARYLGTAGAPECDRVIDFPRRTALLAALDAGNPDPLLASLHAQEDAGSLGRTSPFLQSHDLARLPAEVPDARARRLLQVLEMTLPGDPILYYGEELDLADATTVMGQDDAQRAPMPWDTSANAGFTTGWPWFTPDPGYLDGRNVADASADPSSMVNLVRSLACVHAAIDGGTWEPIAARGDSVLAYARETEEGRVIVVANLEDAEAGDVAVDAHGRFRALTTGEAVDAREGLRVESLGPYEYRVYSDGVAWCAVPA